MEAYISDYQPGGVEFSFEAGKDWKKEGGLTITGTATTEPEAKSLVFDLELPGTGDYYGDQYLSYVWRMTHEEGIRLRNYLDSVYGPADFLGVRTPNIDGLPDEDVDALVTVFDRLAEYCRSISNARYHRKVGALNQATKHEAKAERLFGDLPKELRW